MNPLFSIITVCRNAAEALPATLASVDIQTCRLYEHIIVDGASTDATIDVLATTPSELRRTISEPDKGIYDAMNKGLSLATGDYVLFLNAGDTLHSPDTLQLYADAIMDNDYPGIVYGQTDIVDADRRRIGPRHLRAPEKLTLKSFADGMLVCHQAFVVLHRIATPYNLRWRYSADYEWCVRCLQHSRRNVYVPEVTADYLAEGTTTANRRRSLMERFRIMCYYYGTLPTLLRHVRFAFRALRRRSL
ncbi:MAG: glycosyltransferase [Muribaculaceae bacterium]|nr:glycosyltransferase [Muribaculaceae bacterium]